jgi:signal transduction histidine kinase
LERAPERVRAATLLALTAAYFLAGKLGLALALVHASASTVWPPTGIALAAFLVLGRSVWPAILAGAFFVNVTTEGNAATSLGIAVGNTLEGLAGAWLVARFAGGTAAFDHPHQVFKFLTLAGLLATAATSPTIGVTSLCLGGFAEWSEYGRIWLAWWLGDVGGAVVVAPPLVLWARAPRPAWTRAQALELLALALLVAGLGAIAFGVLETPPGERRPLSFLCLPLTIWAAFRFGPRETASAVLLLSGIAIWGTLRGTGPFPGEREHEALLILQLFLGVVSATSLLLAAVVAQLRGALGVLARQAAELARSNAELDEFAHVVSHDLKAPLRGISSLAAWIAEDAGKLLPDESREHLALLEERARRMSGMIDGVLRYSRAGQRPVALESVDARAVVEEVVDSLGPLPGISVRIEGSLPKVRYGRTELVQVFQNLVQNAVQHLGRPSGEVVVACRERREHFEFCVRDDGVGIAEEHFERVFRLFHTLGTGRATTGVGLAIVKKIVQIYGGSVAVESTPGRGATFRFTVPKGHAPRRGNGARGG